VEVSFIGKREKASPDCNALPRAKSRDENRKRHGGHLALQGRRCDRQAHRGKPRADGVPARRLRQHAAQDRDALDGHEAGYEANLQLKPQDAFGVRDESLARTIPKKEFPPGVKVGGQLEGHTDDGQPHVFHVMKIKGDTVFLDGNHPLAGRQLRFHLKVTAVRKATAEEIEHRHVHGAHGHQH
jgi:FKBP-type peptidyl-prolyl cis-trans isomerase SlyD